MRQARYLNHRTQQGRVVDDVEWQSGTTLDTFLAPRDGADFGAASLQLAAVPAEPFLTHEQQMQLAAMGYGSFDDLGRFSLKKAVSSVSSAAKSTVKAVAKPVANVVKAAPKSVAKAATSAAKTTQKSVKQAVKTAPKGVKSAVKATKKTVASAGKATKSTVKSTVKGTVTGVRSTAKGLRKEAQAAVKGVRTDARNLAKDVKKGAKGVAVDVRNIRKGVTSAGQSIGKEVKMAGDSIGRNVVAAGKGIARAPLTITKAVGSVAKEAARAQKGIAKEATQVIDAGVDAAADLAVSAGRFAVAPLKAAGVAASRGIDALMGKKKGGGGGGGEEAPGEEEQIDQALDEGGMEEAIAEEGEPSDAGMEFAEESHSPEGGEYLNEQGDYVDPSGEYVQGQTEFDAPAAVAMPQQDAVSYPSSEPAGEHYQSSGGALAPMVYDDGASTSEAFPEGDFVAPGGEWDQEGAYMEGFTRAGLGRTYDPEAAALGAMADSEVAQNQQAIARLLRFMADKVSPAEKVKAAQKKVELERRNAELIAAKATLVRENGGIDPLKAAPLAPLDTRIAYAPTTTEADFREWTTPKYQQMAGAYFGASLEGMGKLGILRAQIHGLAKTKKAIRKAPAPTSAHKKVKKKNLDAVNKKLLRKFRMFQGLYGEVYGLGAESKAAGALTKLATEQVLGDPALKAKLNELALDAGNKATAAGRKAIGDFYAKNKTKLIGAAAGTVGLIGLLAYALLKPRTVKISVAEAKALAQKAG